MATQVLDRKRCVSCNRWGGKRKPGSAAGEVEYDEHDDKGECIEGPWHGSLRSPRNACGQWVLWVELKTPEG
ncbi:hypothetical protein [Azoarcus sp. KH32C]|uniref:hypothetical protein n=1 Tax=Azoarcus sp. KH32C TaxID=748247 RepID=UPI0002386EB6|nr:hypothetical protein [Azoarcus sp. KH32C]BAL24430.1 hypothetical protein AZKH_2117 [Azoarcus sp. KH32C]